MLHALLLKLPEQLRGHCVPVRTEYLHIVRGVASLWGLVEDVLHRSPQELQKQCTPHENVHQ